MWLRCRRVQVGVGLRNLKRFYISNLAAQKCLPCEGGVPPLPKPRSEELLSKLHPDWKLIGNDKIEREFKMKNFTTAVSFVNRVKDISEQEQHHPDLEITNYRNLKMTYYTHSIGGLSENDFICAAKVDHLDSKHDIVLYSYFGSSCSYRVRIALALKSVPYTVIPVDLKAQRNKTEEYKQLNPTQKVPTLVIDGTPVYQSLAIIDMLDELYPNPPLYPHDPHQRAIAKSIVGTVLDIQPHQNLDILRQLFKEPEKKN
eukprot:TRINITY_DN22918_c0_g1_i2.p1 TRINITY_DN22918_c0_g1~~TRINITY_DN22918_c0_g1_i2.p1  ORF type:complete len:258 (+),score=68.54 TRINITY_DN22918_c0_g1_i2:7-780(+)